MRNIKKRGKETYVGEEANHAGYCPCGGNQRGDSFEGHGGETGHERVADAVLGGSLHFLASHFRHGTESLCHVGRAPLFGIIGNHRHQTRQKE